MGQDVKREQPSSTCRPGQEHEDVMTVPDRIEINPKVMMGKPVIRGTRVTVTLLLRKISEGASTKDFLGAYPKLARDDFHKASEKNGLVYRSSNQVNYSAFIPGS